jgi:hypothetical protein
MPMSKRLPYLNMALAVLYFLFYLQQGSWYAAFGILMILLFSALNLEYPEAHSRLRAVLVYLSAAVSAVFAGFLIFSSIHILLDAIDHDYFPVQTILLLFFSLLFSALILGIVARRFFFRDELE